MTRLCKIGRVNIGLNPKLNRISPPCLRRLIQLNAVIICILGMYILQTPNHVIAADALKVLATWP